MERSYLVDTNVIIDWLSGKFLTHQSIFLDNVMNQIPIVSIITKIELMGFNTNSSHEALLKSFLEDSIIINLSDPIVEECISTRKSSKIKLPDAIIAASALTFEYTLLTRNTSDFNSIKGLELLNPHGI